MEETDILLENWNQWSGSEDGMEDETDSIIGEIEEDAVAPARGHINQLDLELLLQNNEQIRGDTNVEDVIFDGNVDVIPFVLDDQLSDDTEIHQVATSAPNSPAPNPVPVMNRYTPNYYADIKKIKWRKRHLVSQLHQLRFIEEPLPPAITAMKEPIQFLQLYLTDELIKDIAFQTNLYAQQRGKTNIRITENQIRHYLAVLFYSSIIQLRNMRLYWHNLVGIPCVKDTLPQKQFETIRTYLHFNNDAERTEDKNNPNFDRLYKVRPIIEHFNKVSSSIPYPRDLSVDENICATKMASTMKQYNPKKPHKWGFKLFMLCGTDGFIYNTEVYSGQGNEPRFHPPNEPNLGASSNVVLRMIRDLPRNRNHRVYFDNWFTSLPLVHHLAKLGIYSVGTVRRNRITNDPLPQEKAMKKKKRGTIVERLAVYKRIPITTILWKDSKLITFLSSYVGKLPVTKVKRFCRTRRTHIELTCPAIVREYNHFMGGVDALGSLIGRGRIKLKSRKWTLRIFYHYLDLMVTNAWLLYRKVVRVPLTLRAFRIEIAQCLTKMGTSTTPNKRGRPPTPTTVVKRRKRISHVPPKPVRKDEIGHLPVYTPGKRQQCKHQILEQGVMKTCNRLSNAKCTKCNTYLCLTINRNCFFDFHT